MDAFQRATQIADAKEVEAKIETIKEAASVISSKAKILAGIHAGWNSLKTSGTYPATDIQKLEEMLNVGKLKALVTAANDYLV